MNKFLAISLIIVALVTGIGIGYLISPYYQQEMGMKEQQMDLGAADRWVDLRYINAMIAHHQGAILLAEQAEENTSRPEIKELAAAIKKGEPELIQELYDLKKTMYNDTYQVPEPTVANLGSADKNADLRFLNALIAHHEAGIMMTEEIRVKSSDNRILDNADAVENFLKGSLMTLKEWRTAWYNVTVPSVIN
jgi:uncharacterized protein (DUF305 family)